MVKSPFDIPPRGPVIDMTSDGEFRPSQAGSGKNWSGRPPFGTFRYSAVIAPGAMKLGGIAILVAVLAGTIAAAALALWLAMTLVPIAIVAGLIGWGALKVQRWQTRRAGPMDIYRR
jgi:hypothetical protein